MPKDNKLTPLQIGRLVLYALAVLAGLAGVITDALGYTAVASTVNSLAATLLVMTGGTAAFNLNKGKQTVNPVDVLDTIGAVAGASAALATAEAQRTAETPRREVKTTDKGYITLDELRGMV